MGACLGPDPITQGDAFANDHALTCGTRNDAGYCWFHCECWCHGFIDAQLPTIEQAAARGAR